MATEESTQNPFTRPGFVAAAIVVAFLVVLGLVIAIINATRAESSPDPSPSVTAVTTTSAPETTTTDAVASICGLKDDADAKPPVTAPTALWEYQGTTAYPTSETYGPGKDDPAGFRYCFQHSPTGALFAAANAIAQGSDPSTSHQWLEYAAANGPHRDDLLKSGSNSSGAEDARLMIQGFRILKYDGTSARVDIGSRGSFQGQTVTVSGVYELVWQDGDWKLSTEVAEPLNVAAIPDLAGYIAWGE